MTREDGVHLRQYKSNRSFHKVTIIIESSLLTIRQILSYLGLDRGCESVFGNHRGTMFKLLRNKRFRGIRPSGSEFPRRTAGSLEERPAGPSGTERSEAAGRAEWSGARSGRPFFQRYQARSPRVLRGARPYPPVTLVPLENGLLPEENGR